MINYNGKIFKPISNSENGETSDETFFYYQQTENILTATYQGGQIKTGHLIGLIDDQGNIDMQYHQVNKNGALMTGICKSTPEILANGKIRLHEVWEWTCADRSKGESIIEEQ
ncbi:n-acetylglutamate synthase [Sphingobacterium sp. MYb382]|uniref:n-acetylglutamate synthase n=1 Tax=Sphingobacterium sp. MYb382 TaxID=2745278 RepID=UPI0030A77A85